MNQSTVFDSATQAAQKSKNALSQQLDRQAATLGGRLSQAARDLEQVGSHLRESGTIGSAAQLADWAAGYADRAGGYLSNGHTDRFIGDLETFGRERPWAIAVSAAALGFIVARVVKSSSARRYQASGYVGADRSAGYAGADYAFADGSDAAATVRPIV